MKSLQFILCIYYVYIMCILCVYIYKYTCTHMSTYRYGEREREGFLLIWINPRIRREDSTPIHQDLENHNILEALRGPGFVGKWRSKPSKHKRSGICSEPQENIHKSGKSTISPGDSCMDGEIPMFVLTYWREDPSVFLSLGNVCERL